MLINTEKQYAFPCGGCICNQCANEVNGRYKAGEMVEPCYNCETCRYFDGDVKNKSNIKTECKSFKITEYQVQNNRKKIRLLRKKE